MGYVYEAQLSKGHNFYNQNINLIFGSFSSQYIFENKQQHEHCDFPITIDFHKVYTKVNGWDCKYLFHWTK